MRRERPVLEPVSAMGTESELSYASGPKSIKPTVKVVWRGGKKVMCTCQQAFAFGLRLPDTTSAVLQVDEENFLHMQEEYYRLKQAEKANEETMRQYVQNAAATLAMCVHKYFNQSINGIYSPGWGARCDSSDILA